jgi:hypothetical protein
MIRSYSIRIESTHEPFRQANGLGVLLYFLGIPDTSLHAPSLNILKKLAEKGTRFTDIFFSFFRYLLISVILLTGSADQKGELRMMISPLLDYLQKRPTTDNVVLALLVLRYLVKQGMFFSFILAFSRYCSAYMIMIP